MSRRADDPDGNPDPGGAPDGAVRDAGWHALHGFGRSVGAACRVVAPRDAGEVAALLGQARRLGLAVTARGAGRSYGDASLNARGLVLDLRQMARMLSWDPVAGIADVEPGLTVEGLWRRTIEDGYWPAVVPGTSAPTLGGCAAMNIHGKNNFRVGIFGDHLLDLDLLTASGEVLRCSRDENPALFHAAVGGLGLLGVITRLRLRLKRVGSGLLRVEPFAGRSFDHLVDGFEERLDTADYLVGWIDGFASGRQTGRGQGHRADHVDADDDPGGLSASGRPLSLHVERQLLPGRIFGVPSGQVWRLLRLVANDPGWRLVNAAKSWMARVQWASHSFRQSHVAFAFLLDYVPDWWRAYGQGGFIQHQLFIPAGAVRALVPQVLQTCQRRGFPTYLAVLKRHRPDAFLLSHGLDGYSLAMDFPVREGRRPALWALAHEIAERVLDAGGTFYMAKDALLRPQDLARAYGRRLTAFLELKRQLDPESLFTSDLARRLLPSLGRGADAQAA